MKIVKSHPGILLFIAIAAISSASLLIRIAQQSMDSLFIAAGRLLIAGLLLAPVQMKHKMKEITSLNRKTWLLILLSSIFLALHFAFWISSLEMTKVITSVVLVTTTPIWVSLLAPLLLGETLRKRFYFGLAIALLGSFILILTPICAMEGSRFVCGTEDHLPGGSPLFGNVLALLGAICAAGYVIAGKKIRNELSNLTYVSLVYSIAGLISLSAVFIKQGSISLVNMGVHDWLNLFWIAVIPQLIGHSLINAALGTLPAAHISLALLGEPVGSAILAFIFLHEIPTVPEGIGAAVLIGGIYLAVKQS